MNIEFKKTGKKALGKLGVYTLVVACIAALGIGSYSYMRKSLEESVSQYTVDWDNQGGTLEADKPEKEVTVQFKQPEKETAEETVTERTDNLPFTGSFALPLGTKILKDYSDGDMVSSKTMGDWRVHNGVDFPGDEASQVISVQDGTVKAVYSDELWGSVIEVDCGNGMLVRYCGVRALPEFKKSAAVKKGEVLGTLDLIPVEAADGLHLHLEITVDGETVDPLSAMNRAD